MKRRDPKAKKKQELDRDHRVLPLEGDKTFRKKWRRKKALANRAVRHAENIALRGGATEPEKGEEAATRASARRKRKLQKVGVVSLRQHLQVQADPTLRYHQRYLEKDKNAREKWLRSTRGRPPSP